MVLRLHAWGPAFGLASIDPECLATVTYLAYAVPSGEWELVATSPSGVPTHSLPSLQDTKSGTWTTGFTSITGHIAQLNPAWHLGGQSPNASQRADATAYTAFLNTTAAPLVALSLYVSSANWADTTRPAYSQVLPFPLTWTEPLAVRRQMCDVAEHLGLSHLNIDDDGGDKTTSQAQTASREDGQGWLRVPERLRPRLRGVKAALSPEQTALFRLEAVARECLDVLEHLKRGKGGEDDKRFFFGDEPTALDCLAFGYLALMLVPEVPRPWLRDLMRRRHECLCVYVDGVRDELFGGDVASSLPWRQQEAALKDEPWKSVRFARGLLKAAAPGEWLISARPVDQGRRKQGGANTFVAALCSSAALLGPVCGLLLYHHLSPFGSTLYRWEMQRRSGLGTAGAFFGIYN